MFTSYNNPSGPSFYKWKAKTRPLKGSIQVKVDFVLCESNLLQDLLGGSPVFSHLPVCQAGCQLLHFLVSGLLLGCLRAAAFPVFVYVSCISSNWRADYCPFGAREAGNAFEGNQPGKENSSRIRMRPGAMEKHVQFTTMTQEKAKFQREIVPGMTQNRRPWLSWSDTVSPPEAG